MDYPEILYTTMRSKCGIENIKYKKQEAVMDI